MVLDQKKLQGEFFIIFTNCHYHWKEGKTAGIPGAVHRCQYGDKFPLSLWRYDPSSPGPHGGSLISYTIHLHNCGGFYEG